MDLILIACLLSAPADCREDRIALAELVAVAREPCRCFGFEEDVGLAGHAEPSCGAGFSTASNSTRRVMTIEELYRSPSNASFRDG